MKLIYYAHRNYAIRLLVLVNMIQVLIFFCSVTETLKQVFYSVHTMHIDGILHFLRFILSGNKKYVQLSMRGIVLYYTLRSWAYTSVNVFTNVQVL